MSRGSIEDRRVLTDDSISAQDCTGIYLDVPSSAPHYSVIQSVDANDYGQASIPDCPVFDQRPGELEATRGLTGDLVVCGQRPSGGTWQVAVIQGGELLLELTPADAWRLIDELAKYAALLEDGNAGVVLP